MPTIRITYQKVVTREAVETFQLPGPNYFKDETEYDNYMGEVEEMAMQENFNELNWEEVKEESVTIEKSEIL